MSGSAAYRWVVEGKVQGVGFRHFTRDAALELGLRGTVRNLDDGRVEILVSGPEGAIARLRARVGQGPSWATVSRVSETEVESADFPSPFEVCF